MLSLIVFFLVASAQGGEISGKVTDENGEGIPYANVQIVDNKGATTGRGSTTDLGIV